MCKHVCLGVDVRSRYARSRLMLGSEYVLVYGLPRLSVGGCMFFGDLLLQLLGLGVNLSWMSNSKAEYICPSKVDETVMFQPQLVLVKVSWTSVNLLTVRKLFDTYQTEKDHDKDSSQRPEMELHCLASTPP